MRVIARDQRASRSPSAGAATDSPPTCPHRHRLPTPASRASTSCAQRLRSPRVTRRQRRRHRAQFPDISPSSAFAYARVTGSAFLRVTLAIAAYHAAPMPASPRTTCRRLPIVSVRPRPRHGRRRPAPSACDRHATAAPPPASRWTACRPLPSSASAHARVTGIDLQRAALAIAARHAAPPLASPRNARHVSPSSASAHARVTALSSCPR